MDYVLDFEDLDKSCLPLAGGKNASLGEMIKTGIRVPPGFAVTTESYLLFITETGIKDKIFRILDGFDPKDVKALDDVGSEVQELVNTASVPRGRGAPPEIQNRTRPPRPWRTLDSTSLSARP